LVEDLAEPRLEHVHLAIGDGDALGPIVHDAPIDEVMLHRPPRPAFGRVGVVVKVNGDRDTVEAPRPAKRARIVHLEQLGSPRIARE
jgi:hypothetical protein